MGTSDRESFVFYRSFFEALQNVPKKNRADVYEAVFAYVFEASEPSLSGVSRALWELMRPQLDSSMKRYENAKKGAEYGKLGGRPRKTDEKTKPLKGNETKTLNDNVNVNVNDNDNSNVNDNENDNENVNVNDLHPLTPSKGDGRQRFTKPTVEEVAFYCQERMNGIDAQEFIDFYESKGWMIGKSPMKDWKACVRTWERSRKNKEPPDRYADIDDWYRRRTAEDDQRGIFDNQPSDQSSVS